MTTPQIKYDPSKIVPQELWDLDKIRTEPLRARVRWEDAKDGPGGLVKRQEIYYTSHVWRGQAIRIAAHVALPQAKGKLPVMVLGSGSLDSAESFARTHNVACIAIDRPGTGDSNGPGDIYQTWIALEEDPRDGWMWHYVTSVLRAITYMQQQAEMDGAKVGVTGGSRGGTMSLI
ncbi:MAG: acetylxylan esterase, partial [Planctomycetes bacterium]|nr:acetylxylan esterase [Planctomycetota bacterium]